MTRHRWSLERYNHGHYWGSHPKKVIFLVVMSAMEGGGKTLVRYEISLFKKPNIFIHEKNFNFCSICPLKPTVRPRSLLERYIFGHYYKGIFPVIIRNIFVGYSHKF